MDPTLLREWLDGDLDEAGDARLQASLRDPAMAREFLRELHLDLALRRTAKAQVSRMQFDPAPSEPLRVQLRPSAKLTARSRRRRSISQVSRPLALAALVLIAVGLVLINRPAQPPSIVRLILNNGSASVAGDVVSGTDERDLAAGTVVTIPARGWASLRYPDGTVVEVLEDSQLTVGERDGGKLLLVERGELRAEVRKQPPGHPLVIATPRAETTVLGTRLSVSSGALERVAVEEGRVHVARLNDHATVEVSAGESVELPVTGQLTVAKPVPTPPALPAEEAPVAAGLQLWLCADRGVATDAQGRVWQWRDQSPRGATANQAEAEFQPRLVPTAMGDHAAVSFDSVDDTLVSTTPWPEFHAYTVAVVLRSTAFGSWSQMFGCGWGIFTFHGDGHGGVFTGVGAPGGGIRFSPELLPGGTLRLNAWQRFVVTFANGSGSFYSDGHLLATKSMPTPRAWGWFHIGRLRPPPQEPAGFGGDLNEILVYDRALDEAELKQLDQRLRRRMEAKP